MKNLHILPTDKPSRVFITKSEGLGFDNQILENTELNCQNKNIYITSDEEIKQDWFISFNDDESFMDIIKNYAVENFNDYADEDWVSECEKIILTTDQDLIKDGVQAIDDEFLEWFVNNPSCEYVDINRDWGYPKIIIPQEEPKDVVLGYKTSIVAQMLDLKEVKEEPKK
jgi:ABC-type oligopeptide transport system substrate-binding subunit